jgi:hypothetical protein
MGEEGEVRESSRGWRAGGGYGYGRGEADNKAGRGHVERASLRGKPSSS